MSKYIIDTKTWANLFEVQRVGVYGIGNDIVTDEKSVWIGKTFPLDELEELNSDYINEHFGSLQDEAYRKGLHNGESKCRYCNEYQRGFEDGKNQKEDSIEVGDEVIWYNEATIIVTKVYVDGGSKWCDGVSKRGRVSHVLLENVRKTGKHYDIQSILEAMKQ